MNRGIWRVAGLGAFAAIGCGKPLDDVEAQRLLEERLTMFPAAACEISLPSAEVSEANVVVRQASTRVWFENAGSECLAAIRKIPSLKGATCSADAGTSPRPCSVDVPNEDVKCTETKRVGSMAYQVRGCVITATCGRAKPKLTKVETSGAKGTIHYTVDRELEPGLDTSKLGIDCKVRPLFEEREMMGFTGVQSISSYEVERIGDKWRIRQ